MRIYDIIKKYKISREAFYEIEKFLSVKKVFSTGHFKYQLTEEDDLYLRCASVLPSLYKQKTMLNCLPFYRYFSFLCLTTGPEEFTDTLQGLNLIREGKQARETVLEHRQQFMGRCLPPQLRDSLSMKKPVQKVIIPYVEKIFKLLNLKVLTENPAFFQSVTPVLLDPELKNLLEVYLTTHHTNPEVAEVMAKHADLAWNLKIYTNYKLLFYDLDIITEKGWADYLSLIPGRYAVKKDRVQNKNLSTLKIDQGLITENQLGTVTDLLLQRLTKLLCTSLDDRTFGSSSEASKALNFIIKMKQLSNNDVNEVEELLKVLYEDTGGLEVVREDNSSEFSQYLPNKE